MAIVLALAAAARLGAQAPVPLRLMYHRAWVADEGPPLRGAHRLIQGPDGYLWLSGVDGLMRFDGVRFTVFDSSTTPALRSASRGEFLVGPIEAGALLFTRPDRARGKYLNGRFEITSTPDPELGRDTEVDGGGRQWLYGGRARIYIRENGRTSAARLPPEVSDRDVTGIVRDTGTGVWIGTHTRGLWHVVGDRAELVSDTTATPRPDVRPLLQSSDGTLWAIGSGLGEHFGLHRWVRGQWLPVLPPGSTLPPNANDVVEDSAHAVWIGTVGYGVLRWDRHGIEQFSMADGLSDASVFTIMAGASGSIWIATAGGALDLLRPTSLVTLGPRDGLPFTTPYRIVQDDLGTLWGTGLDMRRPVMLRGGALDARSDSIRVQRIPLLESAQYELLGRARGGGVWLGPDGGGLTRYRNDRVDRWTPEVHGLPTNRVRLAAETPDGAVWIAIAPRGFGVLRNDRYTRLSVDGDSAPGVMRLVASTHGHVWVLSGSGSSISEFLEDRLVRHLGASNGLPEALTDLIVERGDTLWAAADGALARIIGGRVSTVRSPELDKVLTGGPYLGIAGGYLWIVTDARIGRVALAAVHAAADGKVVKESLVPRLFGSADGVPRPRRVPFGINLPVVSTREGRLFISTPAGLTMFDPAWSAKPRDPSSLHVERILVDGRVIPDSTSMHLPPNPARTTIEYTVTDLLVGERAGVDYRLDPIDTAWIDGSIPRVATYTQLPPGSYRFRTRSRDEKGVPTTREATVAFDVLPAWYQARWFRGLALLLIISAAAGSAIAIQRRRASHAMELLGSEFRGKLAERTRIARELHDTVLQEFTGIVFLLEGLRNRLGGSLRAEEAELSRILTLADSTLFEARQSVWDMRAQELEGKPLAQALREICIGLAAANSSVVQCVSSGTARTLSNATTATVLHIGREALCNALQHAKARTVDVTLRYDEEYVTLVVADDGDGMNLDRLKTLPRFGHFGLVGMRERAARVQGKLSILSAPGKGTRLELVMPDATSITRHTMKMTQ